VTGLVSWTSSFVVGLVVSGDEAGEGDAAQTVLDNVHGRVDVELGGRRPGQHPVREVKVDDAPEDLLHPPQPKMHKKLS